jgi:hypothetical protein
VSELLQLQQLFADSAAQSDIECCCIPEDLGGFRWWRTDSCEAPDRETVLIALRYLALRGLVESHPVKPHLIRFTDAAKSELQVVRITEDDGAHD